MKRRTIPVCGMDVSLVGLGCNNFGGRSGREETRAVVHKALDVGITFFDTANTYPLGNSGASEELLGEFLTGHRNEVVIASKFGIMIRNDPNQTGGSRRYIMRAVEESLRRLKTDWIDLFQIHRPDPKTPIEETLRALDDLTHQGKVRYVGCSNYAAWQIVEAELMARELGTNRFVSCQSEWSLINRDVEKDVIPVLEKYQLGFIPFFPLASGLLTGKYEAGKPLPKGTRLSQPSRLADEFLKDDFIGLATKLKTFAESRGHTLLELAMSWLAAKPVVWSIIAGASRPEQLEQNVKATEWALSADELAEVDRVCRGNQ